MTYPRARLATDLVMCVVAGVLGYVAVTTGREWFGMLAGQILVSETEEALAEVAGEGRG